MVSHFTHSHHTTCKKRLGRPLLTIGLGLTIDIHGPGLYFMPTNGEGLSLKIRPQ